MTYILRMLKHLGTKIWILEKYRMMSDLISKIASENKNSPHDLVEEEEAGQDEVETTNPVDIDNFIKWAKSQASKDLSKFKKLTNISDITNLRTNIASLINSKEGFLMTLQRELPHTM